VLLGGGLRSETALKKSLVDILNWVCIYVCGFPSILLERGVLAVN
jgi:hypothetical protein